MGYYLFDHDQKSSVSPEDYTSLDAERLVSLLANGIPAQRHAALRQLIARGAEAILVRCLSLVDPTVVRLATNGLWECWLNEYGAIPRAQMEHGIVAMNDGRLVEAEEIFVGLSLEYPAWAEAYNKQATVLYMQGRIDESIKRCRQVVALKPDHFGAWNGMVICAIQAEKWSVAREAVRESLRLQPQSLTNLQLLDLIESRLP